MAKLIFNYSAMNSGKTMDLIRTAYNYEEQDYKVLVMKPKRDKKGIDEIQTRAGLTRKVDILIGVKDNIFKILNGKLDDVACIFIDEAQFLTKKQVDDLLIFCTEIDIPVICYGLRTDYRGVTFPGSAELLNKASELHEFKTLCKCKEIARFNARKENGEYVIKGKQVVIDGTKNIEYEPLCEKCFIEKVVLKDPLKKKYVEESLAEIYKNMKTKQVNEKNKVLVKAL